MKTRLTNNYLDLINHVETELTKSRSANSEVIFSVLPSLGSGHFSIQLIEADKPYLLVRQWNQDLGQSIQLGIYNLDSVIINEKEIQLADDDLSMLRNIKKSNIEIKDLSRIIVDGVYFRLTIGGQDFDWGTSDQISIELKEVLNKMLIMAGLQHKL